MPTWLAKSPAHQGFLTSFEMTKIVVIANPDAFRVVAIYRSKLLLDSRIIIYMNNLLSQSSLILVAVITSPRDLEIARLLGWYRIPLRFAPKVVDVDYLAFYQTGGFGAQQRWQINRFAAVRGHELTTRAELFRDEPNHPRAKEEYFKIQLGEMQTLPAPILAGKWKRITFLYTTGDLFQTAQTIDDLVVRSDERAILWNSFRERSLRAGAYQANELPETPIDPLLLAMLGGLNLLVE
jgi:hypothetical protein